MPLISLFCLLFLRASTAHECAYYPRFRFIAELTASFPFLQANSSCIISRGVRIWRAAAMIDIRKRTTTPRFVMSGHNTTFWAGSWVLARRCSYLGRYFAHLRTMVSGTRYYSSISISHLISQGFDFSLIFEKCPLMNSSRRWLLAIRAICVA